MMTRDEYVQKLKSQLDEWNAEVQKWEARSAEVQAEARVEYDRQLATFRQQRDQALAQMREVQSASLDAWQQFARGADEAWARMRESFDKAGEQFRR